MLTMNNALATWKDEDIEVMDSLTPKQMQDLLGGWTPNVVGQNNIADMLRAAVRNRILTKRITAEDIRRVAA